MIRRLTALVSVLLLLVLPACAEPVVPEAGDVVQPDWIVIDVDNTTGKSFVHPASFAVPEGFVRSDFTKYSDGVSQDFSLDNTDPTAPVASLYVDAVAGLTSEVYIQRIYELLPLTLSGDISAVTGTPFTAVIAGEQAWCIHIAYSTPQGDYGCLFVLIDTPHAICITAILSGAYTTPESIQTQEQLLAEAEVLLAGLTIVD